MFIEASGRRKGDNAVMETTVSVGSNACLTFYYNMYGSDIGTLNVRLGNQLIFTKSGQQGAQWIKAEVPLRAVGTQKVGNYKLTRLSVTSYPCLVLSSLLFCTIFFRSLVFSSLSFTGSSVPFIIIFPFVHSKVLMLYFFSSAFLRRYSRR